MRTIIVATWIAGRRAFQISVILLLAKRLSIFLRFDLHQAPRPFLQNQFLFFCKVRVGIRRRDKVSVSLQKTRRNRSKRYILLQAAEILLAQSGRFFCAGVSRSCHARPSRLIDLLLCMGRRAKQEPQSEIGNLYLQLVDAPHIFSLGPGMKSFKWLHWRPSWFASHSKSLLQTLRCRSNEY